MSVRKTKNIDKLLSIVSHPVSSGACKGLQESFEFVGRDLISELEYTLSRKNGFYAFESALCFFTCDKNEVIKDIYNWNDLNGWKLAYAPDLNNILFFAEDVFANQFGLTNNEVVKFDPETGEVAKHSESVDSWAAKICGDYDYETGWSVAKEWQLANTKLQNGYRLLPKIPFVMGGEYEASNLVAVKDQEAMRAYGAFYNQLKDIPDGQQVTITDWISS